MKRRLIPILMAVLMLTALLGACAGDEPAANTGNSDVPAKEYKISLITMDNIDQHWLGVRDGAEAAAKEIGGITVSFDSGEKNDASKQADIVQNQVAGGVNAILLAASDKSALSPAVDAAKAAGVVVVTVDSGVETDKYDAHFGTNNRAAGATAADTLAELLTAAGKTSGKIAIVNAQSGAQTTMERENGFKDQMQATHPEYTILPTTYSDGDKNKAYDQATDFMSSNSDLVGFYGCNEGSSVGVGNAVEQAGKASEIPVVGFDYSDDTKKLLDSGAIDATMQQDPYKMGYDGLKAAVDVLNGKAPAQKDNDTGVKVTRGSGAPVAADPAKEYKISLITMDNIDQHWLGVRDGAEAAAKEIGGITVSFDSGEKNDASKQSDIVQNKVASGVNAILLAASDKSALSPAVEAAKAQGIVVVTVDSGVETSQYDAHFGTNNTQAGATAADTLAALLKAAGKTGGKIAIVNAQSGAQTTMERENGFKDQMKAQYPEYTILPTTYSDGDKNKAYDQATDFMSSNSDLVGFYGCNEGSSVGVGNAVEQAGKSEEIPVVGFDFSDDTKKLLGSGAIDATMQQDPYKMGYDGLKAAVDVLSGKAPAGKDNDTGVKVTTKDNMG
ncbi:MAG: ABC transporter substrate-binding protein [Oscillospiraceae bacterium]|jgi:ribose transport system substrate-binding protein|nr:ABC transporter substrate-binding protein [Oscillospiraceae bacterium]